MDQQLDLKLDVKEAPAIPQYSGKLSVTCSEIISLTIPFQNQNTGTLASLRKSIKSRRITKVNSQPTPKTTRLMINKKVEQVLLLVSIGSSSPASFIFSTFSNLSENYIFRVNEISTHKRIDFYYTIFLS